MAQQYYKEKQKQQLLKLRELIGELPAFCRDFFLGIEQQTSVSTRLNYAFDLKVFFHFLCTEIPVFKRKGAQIDIVLADLDRLTAMDVEHFLQYLSFYIYNGNECANDERAKARKLSAVRSLLKYFFNKDLLSANIAEKVSTPKLHEKAIIRLEIDEIVKIINAADYGDQLSAGQKRFHNPFMRARDVALLTLFLGTGIRISECVGLDIADVNFDNYSFKVVRKGGNEAVLYFSDEVADALMKYLHIRNAHIEDLNKTAKVQFDTQALFLSIQNKRISQRAVQDLVKKYSRIASPLKNITPHKLRSTYGTALYRETKDIYVVADVLGHKDVNTTKKHYAALSDDIRRQAAGKVKLRDKQPNADDDNDES